MDALIRFLKWLAGFLTKAPAAEQEAPQSHPSPAPMETWLDVCEPFVQEWEGCRLTAYWDSLGKVYTIGYGATGPGIIDGTVWTQAQANTDLRKRLLEIGDQIDHSCPVVLTDNQKAALADFAYNEGIARLTGSDIYQHLKDRDPVAAMKELLLYDKAKGVTVAGLENRRVAEARLFDT